MSGLNPDSV